MNLSIGIKSPFKSRAHRGFALVTALSLMAFMLVLVVTLLSLMEVETRSADNNLELQKAREGARLGLAMAIGKLQEYAGEDERVTARADILGVDSEGASRFEDEARYWTGVWQSSGSGTGWPKWLVSWHTPNSDPDPSSLPAEGALMLLVGEGSGIEDDDNYVYAPKIDVLDENGNVSSRIAWWVGDEGVKASFAQLPLNQRPITSPNFVPETSKNALKTMVATSHGLERVFNDYDRFISDEANDIDLFSSVEDLVSQTNFTNNQDFEHIDVVTVTEEIFHTLTPMSYGLLTSTESGVGLMEDLSLNSDLLDTEVANYVNRGFTSAATRTGNLGSLAAMREFVPIRGIGTTTLSDGDIANLAAPILTNFMLAFAVFYEDPTAANPSVRVHFFSEFWNPYTSGFQMSDGVNEYELELRITGLPTITINTSSGGASQPIDLQTELGGPGGAPPTIRLKYDFDPTTFEAWYPGMTKNWTGISNATYPYESTETLLKTWADDGNTYGGSSGEQLTVGGRPNIENLGDTYTVTGTGVNPTDEIGVEVYLINLTTGDEALLTQINGIEYSRLTTTTIDPLNPTGATFGYQFILRGPRFGDLDPDFGRGLWLSATDPRNPTNSVIYAQTVDGLGGAIVPTAPEALVLDPALQVERPERLFNRSGIDNVSEDHFRLWQESPLFELPRERVLSLASLQHLYFHNERPFKVGNSWGDEGTRDTLQWFDRYFFSGLSPSDSLNSFEQHNGFPNPILTTYNNPDPTDFNDEPESVAQNALVAGRFNLNSTSVSAWKAVLGGLRIDSWPYVDYYPDGSSSDVRISSVPSEIADGALENRSNLFARFSSTLHETYDVFQTPGNSTTVAPSEYYRRGVRYLTSQQIEDLAVNIVRQIRASGTPFLTVRDFLNNPDPSTGSIIEEAIQASVFTDSTSGLQQWDHSWETEGTGENDDSDKIDIDQFSPGFLTQADIMTAIGPMLAPRSDTFKIRARCQTLSPFDATEVIGDATVEAVVQRVPDPVDPNGEINDSINRQFKIMSVRWLTEDQL